jgi:hypothetical protein
MKNTAAFSNAVGKNFIAGKNQEDKQQTSGSSSRDEQIESDTEEKEEVEETADPNVRGLNPMLLQLVLKHFPMKGVKPSSVTSTGCDKAAKSNAEVKALYLALQQCMKAKCGNQTCKSRGKKCTYCYNPP